MAVIDVHIHVASKDRDDCRVSEEFEGLAAFTYMLVANGIRRSDLRADFDGTLRDKILGTLQGAELVDRGVILALDWSFDEAGNRLDEHSHLVVSNDYVMQLARQYPEVIFGASVHPDRPDARQELERVIEGSPPAALLKWVPNSQVIDPDQPRHDWLYELLAEHDLPLLCHCGPEYAIPVPSDEHQRLGDPRKLRRALDLGVKVIVPHAATRFFPTDELDFLDELAAMMAQAEANGWQLYADLSALCVLCRVGTIERVVDALGAHADRLILGSDYPIPINDIPPLLARDIDLFEHLGIVGTRNPLDKNYKQLLAMDFPESIGTAAERVLPRRALDWTA